MLGSAARASDADWPSYSHTLSGDHNSVLAKIDRTNVQKLKVRCTFDTGTMTSAQSGIIEVGGVLDGTTEMDTFAVDPGR